MTREPRPPSTQPSPHRLLPVVGVGAVAGALLAHLAGGAVLVHLGLGTALAFLGVNVGSSRGRVMLLALPLSAAVGALFLVVAAARRGTVGRGPSVRPAEEPAATSGTLLRGAPAYDRHVALLTLGRGDALRQRTVDLARIVPGDCVLDIGCGTGTVTMLAKVRAGRGGMVAGIDPSPEMIVVARQKAARAGLDIDYRVAAAESLPFADAVFDVVLASLMLHHLPADLRPSALAAVRRVLKPGGRLVVVDFRRPTSGLGRMAPAWLLHRSSGGHALQDLPPLLRGAGFGEIETGEAGAGYLAFVRARRSEETTTAEDGILSAAARP